jgi:uncharacterized protein (DUF2236 family)
MTTTDSQTPISSPVVDRHDIDRSLTRVRELVNNPRHGVFGPHSMMWRIVKPIPVVPLMLMEAGLLEAPHPFIAFGTMGSKSATEFVPRFHRSADAFYDWFCGDLDTALLTARRIFGYHSKVSGTLPDDIGGYHRGQPYEANEQDLLIWVWATLIRPLKEYYEILEGRLSPSDIDRYYDECRRFALLFGIDENRLPAEWSSFLAYFDRVATSQVMEVSPEFLRRSSVLSGNVTGPWRERIAITWILSLSAYRLPTKIRDQYPNLPSGRRHRALAAATLGILRLVWPKLPRDVRESPRCRAAWRRVGTEGPSSRLGTWLAAKLPPPYGSSYRVAGVSGHGNPTRPIVPDPATFATPHLT